MELKYNRVFIVDVYVDLINLRDYRKNNKIDDVLIIFNQKYYPSRFSVDFKAYEIHRTSHEKYIQDVIKIFKKEEIAVFQYASIDGIRRLVFMLKPYQKYVEIKADLYDKNNVLIRSFSALSLKVEAI